MCFVNQANVVLQKVMQTVKVKSGSLVEVVMGWQATYGSPVRPIWHVHLGLCMITIHSAVGAHSPAHGLMHRSLSQARFLEQSESTVHSGLHLV